MKGVVVLLLGLLVVCEAKKKDGLQEDFEFVEDGKEHAATPSSGERRTWMLDPDNALCGLLRCGRREVCLLQDRFTAVCVNKAEVTRNGDKIVPMKDAASASYDDLPKSWDALDDYDDDDDDDDDEEEEEEEEDEYYDEEEDEEYLLEDDDDDDKIKYGSQQPQPVKEVQEQPPPQQQQPQQPQQQPQQPQQPQGEKSSETGTDQRLNRRPFAEKQCPSCPVVGPVFLCGSDNRTYSSTCRLNYHNCIHDAAVHIACKGFCPCKEPTTHTAKKERLRERQAAYLTKLRATKDEPLAQALTSARSSSDSSSSSSTSSSSTASSSSSSFSRPEERDNTTRGRLKEAQQQVRNRDNGNRREKHNRDGEKYQNRVRSRLGRVKNSFRVNKNSEHEKNSYKKYNGKYNKENYRQSDKYNAQRRQWTRGNNQSTHKATNTVWGPNECTQEALEAMGNRMLDWFSVIMADTRSRANAVTKAPSWCKPEVSWMLGHLDSDGDGRLSVKELYQLEHDDHERCIKPFIDRCDLDRDIFLSAREWCKCFDKSERPCAALRKASKGLLGGYIPECDSEGYYQATQCHAGAGVCWCVDRHGVELPNTRTRGTPNCEAVVNSEEVSNYVDDDAEDGDDELDVVEGSADMPLDI